jgi:hypothetical protein
VNPVSTGRLAAAACIVLFVASGGRAESLLEPRPLFDGRSFSGWNGDTERVWRIEEGAIVAGHPERKAPRNEFLATDCEFEDFELRYEYRIDGVEKPNAGVQFRSQRIPDHHEVVGYQADIGPGITGALYDESRRRKYLMTPAEQVEREAVSRARDGWNACVVRCEGPRIRITVNGVETVDYEEPDPAVSRRGMIALQIHGNMVGTIRYRNIIVTELPVRRVVQETAR